MISRANPTEFFNYLRQQRDKRRTYVAIAKEVGMSPARVHAILKAGFYCGKSGNRAGTGGRNIKKGLDFYVSVKVDRNAKALRVGAAKRNMSTADLIQKTISYLIESDMFDAVLDDSDIPYHQEAAE